MQTVTVRRNELLESVRANRTNHNLAYVAAITGYKNAVEVALSQGLDMVRGDAGVPVLDPHHHAAKVLGALARERPVEHLQDYDRAIAMLEMSVDETIVLASHEFDQLVRDDWSWKRDFLASTSTYLAGGRP